MAIIKFNYRNAKGDLSERELIQWSENSLYIQGRSVGDSFPKTFRKDRIAEFLVGAELLLNDGAPTAPVVRRSAATKVQVSNRGVSSLEVPAIIDGVNQILFTGFSAAQRVELEKKALEVGMKVMSTPGKKLTFLCYGDNAGPTKVAKAQLAGAFIIDVDQFLGLIDTGELP